MKRLSISFVLFIFFVLIIILAQGLFAQTPVNPSNGATLVPITTSQVTWTDFDDGNGNGPYDVEFTDDPTFTTIVFSDNNTSNTFLNISGLQNNRVYYWRVRDTDIDGSGGDGVWHTYHFTTVLAVPLQSSPANGSSFLYTSPVNFNWTMSGNYSNVNFTVTVASDPGYSTDVQTSTVSGVLNTSISIPKAGLYYWKVDALVTSGDNNGETSTSASSFSFTMTLPGPTLTSPINGLTGVSVLPTFNWNSVSGAVSYKLYVANNPTFATGGSNWTFSLNVGNVTSYNTLAKLISDNLYLNGFPLNNSTLYYWKVAAIDNNGNEFPSITYHFTTTPGFTVSLDSPTTGQQIQTTTVILQWSLGQSANNLTFDVQYKEASSAPSNETFWQTASTVSVAGSGNSSYSTSISVVLGKTYYWRVLIKRTSTGEYVYYPAATTYNYFLTVGGATVTLVPNWPKDGAYIYTNNPRFDWIVNGYTGGLTYQIRYSTSNSVDGTGMLNGADATNYPTTIASFPSVQYLTLIDTLYPGTTYYWQVRAYYSTTGEYSSWSSIEDFVVYGPGTLEVPVPNYPTGGVSVYTNTPRLDWVLSTAGTGLKYQVRYSTSSSTDGSGMLNGGDATNYPPSISSFSENKYLTLPTLNPGTTYYWQVRSYSSIIDVLVDDIPGNGDPQAFSSWSSVVSFVTNGPGTLVVPTPNWPTGGITVYSTNPILTWYLNPYSTGLTYEVDIATSIAGLDGTPDYTSSIMQVQVTGLNPGQTYYWRVRSVNSVPAYSSWSSIASFVIAGGTTATYAVANWPTGGTTVYTNRPELSWYLQGYNLGITGFVVKYKKSSPPADWLTYSPVSNDENGGVYTGISASTFKKQIDVDLTYGATYYWAVYAVGTTTFNPLGQGYFSVVGGPTATTIVNNWPYNGITVNQTSLRFSWNVVGSELGIVDYQLVYSQSDVFAPGATTTVSNITNKYYDVSGLTDGATYYWKVRARYADNTYTNFSTVTYFTVQGGSAIVIAQPVAANPDNIILTINSPQFSWYLPVPVSQSVVYDLEYADNPYFLNSVKVENIFNNSTTINSLQPGKQYFWRVRAKNSDGISSYYSNTGRFGIESQTDVSDPASNLPTNYVLYQNYPNPFNPSTTIRFDLPEESKVTLKIINLLGQEVFTIIDNEKMNPGSYSKFIDLSNLPSGIYFYKLESSNFVSIKKMILIK